MIPSYSFPTSFIITHNNSTFAFLEESLIAPETPEFKRYSTDCPMWGIENMFTFGTDRLSVQGQTDKRPLWNLFTQKIVFFP